MFSLKKMAAKIPKAIAMAPILVLMRIRCQRSGPPWLTSPKPCGTILTIKIGRWTPSRICNAYTQFFCLFFFFFIILLLFFRFDFFSFQQKTTLDVFLFDLKGSPGGPVFGPFCRCVGSAAPFMPRVCRSEVPAGEQAGKGQKNSGRYGNFFVELCALSRQHGARSPPCLGLPLPVTGLLGSLGD